MNWARLTGTLTPPRCAACGERCQARTPICPQCLWDLDEAGPIQGEPPDGIDRLDSVAPHEGIGRDLLAAYKFRGLYGLGEFIPAQMAALAHSRNATKRPIVPVPAAT